MGWRCRFQNPQPCTTGVPLVFGVLPLTVVFAVFPGLAAINLGL